MKGPKEPKADEMAHATDFRRFKDKNDKKPAYVPWFEAVLSDFWHFRPAFRPAQALSDTVSARFLSPLPTKKVSEELERDALGFMGLTTLKVARKSLTSSS